MISAYLNFIIKNPVFSLYVLGAKCIIACVIYNDIKEKMRNTGRDLAK